MNVIHDLAQVASKELAYVSKPSRSKINWWNGLVAIVTTIVTVLVLWDLLPEVAIAKVERTLVLVAPVVPIITMVLRTWWTNSKV